MTTSVEPGGSDNTNCDTGSCSRKRQSNNGAIRVQNAFELEISFDLVICNQQARR